MRGGRGYHKLGRRNLMVAGPLVLAGCAARREGAPGPSPDHDRGRPELAWGVQSGDVTATSALLWSRSDRPARMVVEWSTRADFAHARAVAGPVVTADSDFTGKVSVDGLPAATRLFYRVRFEAETPSVWVTGSFRTPPHAGARAADDVVFAWSGDTNGQGFGIDGARGGMPTFAALRERAPHFFVSCGDAIYADDPIPATIDLPDGSRWHNRVTPAKSHPAATLDDFRGAHLYPRTSREVRALSAEVPTFAIWDDHEVFDNWFPGGPRVAELAPLARRAMVEYAPTRLAAVGPAALYRVLHWGPLLDVFFLDGRSFRTANSPRPPEEAFLGPTQLAWLERALVASQATWKVVACDMPLGLVVAAPAPGAPSVDAYDGFANDSGQPSGRELELAHLFATLRAHAVKNLVWLTADVHYAAAHRYDPGRAVLKDFDAFYEFVAGPMHARSFPRKRFDDTFGPELVYASAGWDSFGSPATGEQYFGVVRIDARTRALSVTLADGRNRDLHTTTLPAWAS